MAGKKRSQMQDDLAARFIREAVKAKSKSLNLQNCNLNEIPEEVRRMKSLTELRLGWNKIAELPEWIGELDSLTFLDASGNRLRSIPDSLCTLSKLRDLILEENRIAKIPDCIASLKSLSSLCLGTNQLQILPESLGKLKKLKRLKFEKNKITELGVWIGQFTSLDELEMEENALRSVDSNISKLKNLTWLGLSSNELGAIPDGVFSLHKLTHLFVDRNGLQSIPKEIGNLPNLKYLWLMDNAIKELPDSMSRLKKLVRVNLSGNRLTTIPDWISSWEKIEGLFFSRNCLRQLPASIGQLPKLIILSADENEIDKLPGLFKNLKLQQLHLNKNKFKAPEQIFKSKPADMLAALCGDKLANGAVKAPVEDPSQSEFSAIMAQLTPWLKLNKRNAWLPKVKNTDGSAKSSKFSGTPWMPKGEEWPLCPDCERPFQLFLQLNLDEMPAEIRKRHGSGILQLFGCRGERGDCPTARESYRPFSKGMFVRVVDSKKMGKGLAPPQDRKYFPTKTIVEWERVSDYPSNFELDDYGMTLEYLDDGRACIVVEQFGISIELDEETAESFDPAVAGDKLGGWPHWSQGAEYPACPKCKQPMTPVFQLASEDHLPFMFGDLGVGHITQCAKHKDVLAFGWAS